MATLVPLSDKQREKFYWIRTCFHCTNWSNDHSLTLGQVDFPVLEGTLYADENITISPLWVEYYGEDDRAMAHYNDKCQFLLEHMDYHLITGKKCRFLLKESLKLFSPYSEKAKELLDKLESFE